MLRSLTGILGNIVIMNNDVLNVENITSQILMWLSIQVVITQPIIEVALIIKSLNVLAVQIAKIFSYLLLQINNILMPLQSIYSILISFFFVKTILNILQILKHY